MATSQSKQALRDFRKTHGLCIECGTGANELRCLVCAEKTRENLQRYYARRKAAGKCITPGCANAKSGGTVRCYDCSVKQRDTERDKVAVGVCTKCTQIATNGRFCNKHATQHAAYMKKFREARIAAGKCPRCGDWNTSHMTVKCDECAVKHRARCARIKLDLFNHYGGAVCCGCGETELAVLQLDHIDGGGNKHAKTIGGRSKMYKWVKDNNYPPLFRVLCANCNVRAWRKLPFPKDRLPEKLQ